VTILIGPLFVAMRVASSVEDRRIAWAEQGWERVGELDVLLQAAVPHRKRVDCVVSDGSN
jgi:hypothetical protein